MATRIRREVEPRWVSEYILATYPKVPWTPRVPLGSVPKDISQALGEGKALRAFRPWRSEADAVVFLPDKLILIEGKIFKLMDGLAKLPVYKALIPSTPELQAYVKLPVEMQLLVVKALAWVTEAAEKMGVKVVEWAPVWIVQIWEERDKYWAPESIAAREQRKQALRNAGLA